MSKITIELSNFKILAILQKLQKYDIELTNKETNFFNSVCSIFLEEKRKLTYNQTQKLNKLYIKIKEK